MSKKNYSDSELVELFKSDEKNGELVFSILLDKHAESLYYFIRKITRNHEETNDVLQNVWIKVWKNLADFKEESSLFTWLYRIARNETLNFIQKEKKHQSVEIDEVFLEVLAGHDFLDNSSPEGIQESLMQAILTLPAKQALVFQLKYFDELKYSEIANKLGTSEGALKASYHLAVKKIEEFLRKELNLQVI